ncbi:MAG: metalloregulator ArsR/SmtB family transcription factor [Acidobacteriota bacterium]
MNGLIASTPTAPDIFDRMGVLSEPTRGRLLVLLEDHELTVTELCTVLQQPQSTVSRHLKVLGTGGWVDSWRDGTSRRYRMDEAIDDEVQNLWRLVRQQIAGLPAATQDRSRLAAVLAERRSRSKEFFSSTAGEWDRLRRELFGEGSELGPLLGLIDRTWVVGDLGCGTGPTSKVLAPFVDRVIAVDESAEMLEAATEHLATDHPNVELRRGSLESLPVAKKELDAALLILVLHHLPDPKAALAEVARVLTPGGKLLVVDMVPHDRARYRQEMGHLWLGFSEDQMTRWLDEVGFETPHRMHLPPDPKAKGPNLFVTTARMGDGPAGKPNDSRN